MIIGIVGSEASKFTPDTEEAAKEMIRAIILHDNPEAVVSGQCHLGGIDIWAIEIAKQMGVRTWEYPAYWHTWAYGYRPRNIKIARASDKVYCLTVKSLPENYTGMRFKQGCYHCQTPPEHHIKSGGCWTMKFAREVLHKETQLIIID